jgi:hypothetical protein
VIVTRAICGVLRTTLRLVVLRGDARRRYLDAWWLLFAYRLRLRFPRLLAGRSLLLAALRETEAKGACCPTPAGLECFRQALADQIFPSSCLPRAVALKRLLERESCRARLELGMKRDAGVLAGHAWVTCGGEVVSESSQVIGAYRAFERAGRTELNGRAEKGVALP